MFSITKIFKRRGGRVYYISQQSWAPGSRCSVPGDFLVTWPGLKVVNPLYYSGLSLEYSEQIAIRLNLLGYYLYY